MTTRFSFDLAIFVRTLDETRMDQTSLDKKRARDARYRDRHREAKRARDRTRRAAKAKDPAWLEAERQRKRASRKRFAADPAWVERERKRKLAAKRQKTVDSRMLLDIRVKDAGRCRFIAGPTAGERTLFCGSAVAFEGSPWCWDHRRICYAVDPAINLKERIAA